MGTKNVWELKEEIVCLMARALSDISNNLPNTANTLHHEVYSPDYNPKNHFTKAIRREWP